ncbi:N-acetylmuramoyl-L-alanine amidase [Nitrosomonas marina]|uniref:N-acetylmuramoyl-L-alanine amidase AmiC n=1 Tax=Nitrosomonas marina TaxID=917 RepID=A0A1I0DA81_9PROT|nr:N-acetylmuramoyl-L-alanine amidase [Nitrosomonas marina]SET29188.1 N-acetylmuramoyl-L-alanine amidase [Nitrosomonas marina]
MFEALARYRTPSLTAVFIHSSSIRTIEHTKRQWSYSMILATLLICLTVFLFSKPAQAADIIINSARLALSDYYSRITLESDQPIQYELSMLEHPGRVVVDLENATLNRVIKDLPGKLDPADPFVERIRFGQFKPHVVRLVFDLKINVVPRTFILKPEGQHGYRLVLDIYYPDKAALAETSMGGTNPTFGLQDDTDDSLGELVASLVKKKPTGPDNLSTAQPPRSFHVAQYHKPSPPRTIIVAIDPGHGGRDPGAVGDGGTREKDITLAISRKLKALIDREPYMRAILTRNDDFDLPLKRRQAIARKHNADLFVSIHADGSPRPHAHGSSVYTLSEHGATSTAASWLAQKENSVDSKLVGGVDITDKTGNMREIILDLSMSATINDSVKVAEFVLNELGQINRLHKKTVEQAGFVVLKSPDIPSILVETAFITNPSEEKKLRNKTYQKKMAHAIFGGIKKYFDTNPALAARTDVARAP